MPNQASWHTTCTHHPYWYVKIMNHLQRSLGIRCLLSLVFETLLVMTYWWCYRRMSPSLVGVRFRFQCCCLPCLRVLCEGGNSDFLWRHSLVVRLWRLVRVCLSILVAINCQCFVRGQEKVYERCIESSTGHRELDCLGRRKFWAVFMTPKCHRASVSVVLRRSFRMINRAACCTSVI